MRKPPHGRLTYIGLGANLGNRALAIHRALEMLQAEAGAIEACSPLIETEAEGFRSAHKFLNAVCALHSMLQPLQLLRLTQRIERRLGRTVKSADGIYHDRPIDIDLLWMEGIRRHTPTLTLPHPLAASRSFVLEPWVTIAPTHRIEPLGPTISQLLQQIRQQTKENG